MHQSVAVRAVAVRTECAKFRGICDMILPKTWRFCDGKSYHSLRKSKGTYPCTLPTNPKTTDRDYHAVEQSIVIDLLLPVWNRSTSSMSLIGHERLLVQLTNNPILFFFMASKIHRVTKSFLTNVDNSNNRSNSLAWINWLLSWLLSSLNLKVCNARIMHTSFQHLYRLVKCNETMHLSRSRHRVCPQRCHSCDCWCQRHYHQEEGLSKLRLSRVCYFGWQHQENWNKCFLFLFSPSIHPTLQDTWIQWEACFLWLLFVEGIVRPTDSQIDSLSRIRVLWIIEIDDSAT